MDKAKKIEKKKKIKFNVKKPTMATATPKKKIKFNVVKKEAKTFTYFYSGNGKLNTFLNDVISSKSKKTNRTVGYKRVEARFKELLKKNPNPTAKEVKEFYNKEYPDKDYYLK